MLMLVVLFFGGIAATLVDNALNPALMGVVIGLAFVVLVFWSVRAPALYFKPVDLEIISLRDPTSHAWVSTTTAGVKAYFEKRYEGSDGRPVELRTSGYVALTSESIEFWQRESQDLVLACACPRSEVISALKSDVAWTVVVQPGVLLTIIEQASRLEVPLSLANPRRRAGVSAVDEFLELWQRQSSDPSNRVRS
jgi:hypothetical protein